MLNVVIMALTAIGLWLVYRGLYKLQASTFFAGFVLLVCCLIAALARIVG